MYRLHTGCQGHQLPLEPDPPEPEKKEFTWDAVYYHDRQWPKEGSLKKVWPASLEQIKDDLDLSEINLDPSHPLAKKGGPAVAYQRRKKAKTSPILTFSDGKGYIIGVSEIMAGNHHDAFDLKSHLQTGFTVMKQLGLDIAAAYFNADSAFDRTAARTTCFHHSLIPNMQQKPKRGRLWFFNEDVYQRRFTAERSLAWIDQFKLLLVRFERKDVYWLGPHFLAFTLSNLRHRLN